MVARVMRTQAQMQGKSRGYRARSKGAEQDRRGRRSEGAEQGQRVQSKVREGQARKTRACNDPIHGSFYPFSN